MAIREQSIARRRKNAQREVSARESSRNALRKQRRYDRKYNIKEFFEGFGYVFIFFPVAFVEISIGFKEIYNKMDVILGTAGRILRMAFAIIF